ncbi:MAG: dihydroorotate dehydrogenase electron transfer subunit [Candidatus Schekmanbacteria bacterium]|nr:MAG: dihydroorotate dehydrogenase electron transfer subunit [Candidatus Schekmanbacteria bacterium]
MFNKIISNKKISTDIYILSLEYRRNQKAPQPGQFFMIAIPDHPELVLRRPFSVCDYDGKKMDICYKIVGKGTSALSVLKKGTHIDILGPFGNEFKLPENKKNIILIAGGIGAAPFLFLSKQIRKKYFGNKGTITLLYGGKSSSDLPLKKSFGKIIDKIIVSTEDGSEGYKGFITEILIKEINKLKEEEKTDTIIFASGPQAMLKEVDKIVLKNDINCQLTAESVMGCGYGVCLGCILEKKDADKEAKKHTLVCTDGPVFNSGEIKW